MSRAEEDDLDDLDDLLDEFAAQVLSKPPGADLENKGGDLSKDEGAVNGHDLVGSSGSSSGTTATTISATTATTTSTTTATGTSTKTTATTTNISTDLDDPSVPELDDKFADQLKFGMDHLLDELKDSPEAQQSFEALIKGLVGSTEGSGVGPTTSSDTADSTTPQQFQDTIAKTMDRLKESRNEVDQKAQTSSEDDFLMNMLKELEGAAGSNGPDLDGLLGEMLKELSSKSILYEPMKEMHDKFPGWMKEHSSSISAEEKARYENQQRIVSDIVNKFEDPKYSDDDDTYRTFIGQRMEEMQKSGAPPPELMGDLASGSIPGLDLTAPDGGLSADEGCPVQ